MISFIHMADFHLDSPFSGLPPQRAAERREEQRALFASLKNLDGEVDLFFLSGDLFDGESVYPETIETMVDTFRNLRAKVFIAPGNHDYFSPRSPYRKAVWPDNVHIFCTEQVESIPLPEHNCVIYGAAFIQPECRTSLIRNFRVTRDGRFHIMVLHGEVGSGTGAYDPITKEEIGKTGLHYLALGHIHQESGLQLAGDTYYAWPGCPQGRGFDETGPKGIYRGEIDQDGVRLTFLPFATRRYECIQVDVTGSPSVETSLLAALPPDGTNDIYRIVLTGESREDGVHLPALYPLVQDRFYHVTLRDETSIFRDIWARIGEDTLTGLFLKRMKKALDTAQTQEEKEKVTQAVRFGLAALEGREDKLQQEILV